MKGYAGAQNQFVKEKVNKISFYCRRNQCSVEAFYPIDNLWLQYTPFVIKNLSVSRSGIQHHNNPTFIG